MNNSLEKGKDFFNEPCNVKDVDSLPLVQSSLSLLTPVPWRLLHLREHAKDCGQNFQEACCSNH